MSAIRVVLVGAESTGKTTLARELCAVLSARGGEFTDTRWVPEYGRDYTIEKLARAREIEAANGGSTPEMADLVWTTRDFVAIALEQNALEERASAVGGRVLICDTDTLATAIWHERYLGARSAEVETLAIAQPSLYLLTWPDDVPFESDEIRDGEHLRVWMTERFIERLRQSVHHCELVRGSRDERVESALRAIDAWLGTA